VSTFKINTWEDADVDEFDVGDISDIEMNVIQVNDQGCLLTLNLMLQ